MARRASALALLLHALACAVAQAEAPPSPLEILSAPHNFQFSGFGASDCGTLFSAATPSLTYSPPAAGVPDTLSIPAAAFAVNGSACKADAGAAFAIRDLGVDVDPALNLFVPADDLLYVYGPEKVTEVLPPQCVGGAVDTPLLIWNFVFLQTNKDLQTTTPDVRNGLLMLEEGVLYGVFDFWTSADGEPRGSVYCLLRDVAPATPAPAAAAGGAPSPAPAPVGGLGKGAIVGIVAGVCALVACFAALLAWRHVSW
jgi:hypothetical protein